MMSRTKNTVALGLAGALALAAASPGWAGPLPAAPEAMKAAAATTPTQVHWRHHGFGPGAVVGGLALGLAGAALAAPYYYGPGYAYDYGPDYDYGPSYGYAYAPGPYWGPRWHHRHFYYHRHHW
jgi:hypothetical protein